MPFLSSLFPHWGHGLWKDPVRLWQATLAGQLGEGDSVHSPLPTTLPTLRNLLARSTLKTISEHPVPKAASLSHPELYILCRAFDQTWSGWGWGRGRVAKKGVSLPLES